MANPNIATAASVYGRTIGLAATTASTAIISAVTASHVYKVNSLIISNINGSAAADVTVTYYNATAATSYYVAYLVSVPAKSTLVVISKDSQIYMQESDTLSVTASANSYLHAIVSYEDIYA